MCPSVEYKAKIDEENLKKMLFIAERTNVRTYERTKSSLLPLTTTRAWHKAIKALI